MLERGIPLREYSISDVHCLISSLHDNGDIRAIVLKVGTKRRESACRREIESRNLSFSSNLLPLETLHSCQLVGKIDFLAAVTASLIVTFDASLNHRLRIHSSLKKTCYAQVKTSSRFIPRITKSEYRNVIRHCAAEVINLLSLSPDRRRVPYTETNHYRVT